MVSGIPRVLGPGARMWDPHVCVVFGALKYLARCRKRDSLMDSSEDITAVIQASAVLRSSVRPVGMHACMHQYNHR